MYSGDFITFCVTILFFFYICNSKNVEIGLPTCIKYRQWKNECHNSQGTIAIHCKRWLFNFIPNLCCYNKLKKSCLGLLTQKQDDDFRTSIFWFIYCYVKSLFMTKNELRIFKLKLYTNFLLATSSFFTSSSATAIKNH